jgi:ubiquinone/menaquinone biosynthesis C-methylase UbiE
MNSLEKLQENWEGFAQIDPLWAICVDSRRRDNRWSKEEFFETGTVEMGRVMKHLRSLELYPDAASPALDFGCGVGRLTRAMSEYFPDCWGIDIAPTMVRLAEEFNRDRAGCRFWLNEADDLMMFPDSTFGFIYSSIVFQHIQRTHAERYLFELIRVLKAGGILVFQVPEKEKASWVAKLRNRVGFRRRLTRLQGRKNLEAYHMAMHCIPETKIRRMLAGQPVRIVDVQLTNSSSGAFNGNLEFLDREPERGFVSKQYCVMKTGGAAMVEDRQPASPKQKAAA